jgi:hypothetical protein
LADGALERVEIRGRMRQLELGARGRSRGDGDTALRQSGSDERAIDRDQALGRLRMLARGAMRAEALVGAKPR